MFEENSLCEHLITGDFNGFIKNISEKTKKYIFMNNFFNSLNNSYRAKF